MLDTSKSGLNIYEQLKGKYLELSDLQRAQSELSQINYPVSWGILEVSINDKKREIAELENQRYVTFVKRDSLFIEEVTK